MCEGCFKSFQHNTQLALHLTAEKEILLYTRIQTHSAQVDKEFSSASVSVQASVYVEGAVECVKTADQIAADKLARLQKSIDGHDVDMGQIQITFRKVLAFVRGIDMSCERAVTREDVFTTQRWGRQALKKDRERREDAAETAEAAAEASVDKEEEDKSGSSSEEEEEDMGVAHDGQLTYPVHVTQLIMGIKYCQNTASSQKFAGERARDAAEQVYAQTRMVQALRRSSRSRPKRCSG
jgi:hypothetical protein